MKENIPAAALSKLLTLADQAEYVSQKLITTEQGIANARQRLTGGFERNSDYDDTKHALEKMVADFPTLKQRCRAAESMYEKCKGFIDDLPTDVVLEPVNMNIDGHDLSSVRTKIAELEQERNTLRGLPTSSSDIEQRVRSYVESLARPTITGTGVGEKLRIAWPGCGWDSSGPRTDRAEVLPLIAMLFPTQMVDALLREIERSASSVVPIKQRAARIADIEAKLEELAYVEEALVTTALANGEDAQRSPNALPQVVLQVRVVEATKSSRTA
jgi:hypothetical protein